VWARLAEKLVDFVIASGVGGTALLLLAGGAFLTAFSLAAYRGLAVVREFKRQREATASVTVTPADDDPTLPPPKGPGYSPAIVVSDGGTGRFGGSERRDVKRRAEDHGAAQLMQIAVNASADAMDARQIAETAEQKVSDLEDKLERKGGLGDRVAVLEATCLRIEGKVDLLPAEIASTLEGRLLEQLGKATPAGVEALEHRLEQLVTAAVAKHLVDRKAAQQ